MIQVCSKALMDVGQWGKNNKTVILTPLSGVRITKQNFIDSIVSIKFWDIFCSHRKSGWHWCRNVALQTETLAKQKMFDIMPQNHNGATLRPSVLLHFFKHIITQRIATSYQ